MSTIDNINGIYVKDTELRSGINALRNNVVSQTIKPLSITKNGTYTADPTVGAYGYSPITVDVQEEPWQPLEDGYSNFWFALTDDTLSPWLNFSAKTNDAVIDWGDGSGEVALDTLTPTHTYSKAGRYVVKVKGVTGIGRINTMPYNALYFPILRYVELNDEITSVIDYAFIYCTALANITLPNINRVSASGFRACTSLTVIFLPSTITIIDDYLFYNCFSLSHIHVQSSTPPTLGTNVFSGQQPNFIIYVPVGTGETYKAASGWSTYADHILEEGQTPNRAMLAKLAATKTDNEEMR